MNAIVKHCLHVLDLYFANNYHNEIDDCLKFKFCNPLNNIIASYILPHNEFLCFVSHMLSSDGQYPCNLKNKIYNKCMHEHLINFCNEYDFDILATSYSFSIFYNNRLDIKIINNINYYIWLICNYNIKKEAWNLPQIGYFCIDRIDTLREFNATVNTIDGKIGKLHRGIATLYDKIINDHIYDFRDIYSYLSIPPITHYKSKQKYIERCAKQNRKYHIRQAAKYHLKHNMKNQKRRSQYVPKRIQQPVYYH
jgi:hypothetical protein